MTDITAPEPEKAEEEKQKRETKLLWFITGSALDDTMVNGINWFVVICCICCVALIFFIRMKKGGSASKTVKEIINAQCKSKNDEECLRQFAMAFQNRIRRSVAIFMVCCVFCLWMTSYTMNTFASNIDVSDGVKVQSERDLFAQQYNDLAAKYRQRGTDYNKLAKKYNTDSGKLLKSSEEQCSAYANKLTNSWMEGMDWLKAEVIDTCTCECKEGNEIESLISNVSGQRSLYAETNEFINTDTTKEQDIIAETDIVAPALKNVDK